MNAIFESVSSFSIYLLCRKNTTGITNFDDNFSRSAWTFCGLDCQSTRGLWSSVGCVCFVASVAQIVVVALRGSPFIPFLPIAHPKWSNGARQKILQSGRSNSFSSLQLVQFCVACCSSCFIGRNGGWRLTGAGNCEVLATAQVQTKCAERERESFGQGELQGQPKKSPERAFEISLPGENHEFSQQYFKYKKPINSILFYSFLKFIWIWCDFFCCK